MRASLLVLLAACGSTQVAPPPPPPANHVPIAPLAIAFVYNGWEVMMGNNEIVDIDDPSYYIGLLKELKAALDKADIAGHVPEGSLGLTIAYADRAAVVLPIGSIRRLVGAALGSQKDYYNLKGEELVSGVDLARSELDRSGAAKKVMIIFGDGNDTNADSGKARLSKLKGALAAAQIAPYAIVFKGQLSDMTTQITALDPKTRVVTRQEELETALAAVLDDCCKR